MIKVAVEFRAPLEGGGCAKVEVRGDARKLNDLKLQAIASLNAFCAAKGQTPDMERGDFAVDAL